MLGKGKAKDLVPAQGQSCLYAPPQGEISHFLTNLFYHTAGKTGVKTKINGSTKARTLSSVCLLPST